MEMEPGKLFIGGISWDTNEDRMREYFQAFGEVLEAVIMKDRCTGRARGFGFVVFADPNVAERVVREKHVMDGRIVEAKKAVPRDDQHILSRNNSSTQGSRGPIRTKKIFVGGLASSVTESDFKRYFDQFGIITDVVVMYDHNTQRPRGFGFITYDSEEAVEKVLIKTFHELNGKMVEVKRAVPKELSPSPSRSPLSGYNHGLSRVSSFLNAYSQGYNPSPVGGYGARMDGRFSPVTIARGGYPPIGPSGYSMGLNIEPRLSVSSGGSGNFNSSLGRGVNSFYSGNSNRDCSLVGYGGDTSGTGSVLSSTNRNMWGNGSLNYGTSSSNSTDFIRTASGNSGLVSAFENFGSIWGSSPLIGQAGDADSAYGSNNVNYGGAENNFGLRGGGYIRNRGSNLVPTSFAASNDGTDGAFRNFNRGGSFYGDPTWRSPSPELENVGSFIYGLGNMDSDVTTRNPARYVGGYSVTNRANSGIAA